VHDGPHRGEDRQRSQREQGDGQALVSIRTVAVRVGDRVPVDAEE